MSHLTVLLTLVSLSIFVALVVFKIELLVIVGFDCTEIEKIQFSSNAESKILTIIYDCELVFMGKMQKYITTKTHRFTVHVFSSNEGNL